MFLYVSEHMAALFPAMVFISSIYCWMYYCLIVNYLKPFSCVVFSIFPHEFPLISSRFTLTLKHPPVAVW